MMRGQEMIKFENLGIGGHQFFLKFTNRGGSKFFHFSREGGHNFSYSSKKGVQNFCHVILNSTTPYCWVINDQPLRESLSARLDRNRSASLP